MMSAKIDAGSFYALEWELRYRLVSSLKRKHGYFLENEIVKYGLKDNNYSIRKKTAGKSVPNKIEASRLIDRHIIPEIKKTNITAEIVKNIELLTFIGCLPSNAPPLCTKMLRRKAGSIKIISLKVLSKWSLHDETTFAAIQKCMDNNNWKVRLAAFVAVKKMIHRNIVHYSDIIFKALNDEKIDIQLWALYLLRNVGGYEQLPENIKEKVIAFCMAQHKELRNTAITVHLELANLRKKTIGTHIRLLEKIHLEYPTFELPPFLKAFQFLKNIVEANSSSVFLKENSIIIHGKSGTQWEINEKGVWTPCRSSHCCCKVSVCLQVNDGTVFLQGDNLAALTLSLVNDVETGESIPMIKEIASQRGGICDGEW